MISTLVIPSTPPAERLDLGEVKRDLVEGLRPVKNDRKVRPWIVGIAFTFTAAGGVFSLGIGFVDSVLGGDDRDFALLIGFLGTGMILGLLAVGLIARRIQKDVLFSASIVLLGAGLFALASMSSSRSGRPHRQHARFLRRGCLLDGVLAHAREDQRRREGRTFSAAYTVIRIGTSVGLASSPIADQIGDHTLAPLRRLDLPGSRVTLWLAGLVRAVEEGVLDPPSGTGPLRSWPHLGKARLLHRLRGGECWKDADGRSR